MRAESIGSKKQILRGACHERGQVQILRSAQNDQRRAQNDPKGESVSAAGVTLMELLVVIALASILLAIVFPAVGSGLGTLELRSAATRVAAVVRYARDQAVYRQKTMRMEINGEAGTVSVADLEGGGQRRYEFPDTVRVEEVLPSEDAAASRTRRFFFFPDGASPDFEIILTNTRRQLTVVGDALTGTAKVVEQ